MRSALVILLFFISISIQAQTEECNQLGAWLWHLEYTSESTHASMAERLAALDMKRVYVKVSDGRIDTTRWDEMVDKELVQDYREQGLEVWGWSYNYLANDSLQAEALYLAAKTGYDGYVVDVEIEFDGNPLGLFNLFYAFDQAKERAIQDGYITDDFPVYCTTWGNPKDHNYAISVIDPYVDAFMPQTYVEQWGIGYVTNLEFWIERGDREYEELGATKPVHHILAMYDELVDYHDANRFFKKSGPESSIWRVPGGGVSESYWDQWEKIEWDMDFCESTHTEEVPALEFNVFPNPAQEQINIKCTDNPIGSYITISDLSGKKLRTIPFIHQEQLIDLIDLANGYYLLTVHNDKFQQTIPFIKMGQ